MSPTQSATSQWGWGFHTMRGGIDPEGFRFRPRLVSCRDMEGYLIRGKDPILPGCGRISTMSRGATLVVRWLHDPSQSATSQWGWGFHTVKSGIDPGGSPFSSLVY